MTADPDRIFWLAIYRAVCGIATAIKKRYLENNDRETVHVRFTDDEMVWRSRELEPDLNQESPFVKLR